MERTDGITLRSGAGVGRCSGAGRNIGACGIGVGFTLGASGRGIGLGRACGLISGTGIGTGFTLGRLGGDSGMEGRRASGVRPGLPSRPGMSGITLGSTGVALGGSGSLGSTEGLGPGGWSCTFLVESMPGLLGTPPRRRSPGSSGTMPGTTPGANCGRGVSPGLKPGGRPGRSPLLPGSLPGVTTPGSSPGLKPGGRPGRSPLLPGSLPGVTTPGSSPGLIEGMRPSLSGRVKGPLPWSPSRSGMPGRRASPGTGGCSATRPGVPRLPGRGSALRTSSSMRRGSGR